jgi:hypothetical protein
MESIQEIYTKTSRRRCKHCYPGFYSRRKENTLDEKDITNFQQRNQIVKAQSFKEIFTISAAQQGSFITPAGSSKKPSFDVVLLSSELDELDIAERSLQDMIPLEQPTMPSGPSTQSTHYFIS